MACKPCGNGEREVPAGAPMIRRFLKAAEYQPVTAGTDQIAYDGEDNGQREED